MEPIILELEREENDLLIIAHESVLRVLYGYLMACSAADIPKLDFPRDEIIEVSMNYVLAPFFTNCPRSYRPATTMLPSASRSPASRNPWSPAPQRTSRFPCPQVGM
jgi:hypothetical protein